MDTITVEVYRVEELQIDAFNRAYNAWCESDWFRLVFESYAKDITDDLNAIMTAIGGDDPDEETAEAIVGGGWRDAFCSWAGHDIAAFIDAQTDITDDMRDYLQTLHRMTDLAKDARGDAADALESAIYDIRSSICSLAKWLVDRINNKVDDMRGALWDDLQTKEGFIEDATANVWRFTADGDRWDR